MERVELVPPAVAAEVAGVLGALLDIVGDAAGKTVAAHHHCLRAAAAAQAGPDRSLRRSCPPPGPSPRPDPSPCPGPCRLAERTRDRYTQVQECLARGLSRAAAARELNLDIQTVRRFANASCAEELLGKAEHRSTKLDPFIDLVNQRWNEGVTNAVALAAELRTFWLRRLDLAPPGLGAGDGILMSA